MTKPKRQVNPNNFKTGQRGAGVFTHEELRRAHNLSPMGVLAIDTAGIIVYANKAALNIYNSSRKNLLGQSFFSRCEDHMPGKPNEAKINNLEEIIDQEFKVISEPEEHCVLVSSLVFREIQGDVQTYLFIRDISRLKKGENLVSYLNQAATALVGVRDTAGALEKIAEFIVPKFADWFTIDLLKDDRLELLLLKHEDPEKIKWAYQYRQKYPNETMGDSGPAMVLQTGKSALVPVITRQMIEASITDPVQRREVKKIGLHSAILVPMSVANKTTGLVNFISSQTSRHFDEADLDFAQNFANLIALALENARLNGEAVRELELRKLSEDRFRFLTDAIPHKLWTSAPDGHATYYNQQWYNYTGIKGFETLRENIWDFIHPEDRQVAETEWPAAIAKGEPMEMEQRLMRSDGFYRWHLSRFSAYKKNEEQLDLWVGTSTDIHEQKIASMQLAAANEELTAANEKLAAINEKFAATNNELLKIQSDLEKSNSNLVESESRLRMAIDATGLGTWDYNAINGDLYFSEECRAIFGLDPHAAISFDVFSKLVHPQDRDRITQELQELVRQRRAGRYEIVYRIIRSDNQEIRWINAHGTAFFDDNGNPQRFIGTLLDITENMLAQEAVARSEELFRSIALNIPKSVIIIVDKNHHYVMIEGDIIEKLGYGRKNYVGKHPRDVGSPERYEASRHLYERVLAGEKFSLERKGEAGDNYMVHFVPLRDKDNEINAGLIIALDITDIKQAEERDAKLAAIVDSSDDAIISKTLEGVVTNWNKSAEDMFGYTADEMIGQSIYHIIPHDRQEEEATILARLQKGERIKHFETKRVTKDGRLLDVSLTISPVKDKEGNIIGLSKIARDISDKKLEEQRKNDFIGMVSHELKTPLTSLFGFIQVTQAKLKNGEDAFLASTMERANIQVKKMTAMINGFLNVSQLEAGKMSLDHQVFDLNGLLKEIWEETKLLVTTHPINLVVNGPVWLEADRDKIGSVISNLISNAVKYSPQGKSVDITCQASEKEVTVAIKDEGIGIKGQDMNKIFDRYHRVKTEFSRHVSGFGIGLYLSSEIIELHKGKIWAESQYGQGSTFYFSLPLTVDNKTF